MPWAAFVPARTRRPRDGNAVRAGAHPKGAGEGLSPEIVADSWIGAMLSAVEMLTPFGVVCLYPI